MAGETNLKDKTETEALLDDIRIAMQQIAAAKCFLDRDAKRELQKRFAPSRKR